LKFDLNKEFIQEFTNVNPDKHLQKEDDPNKKKRPFDQISESVKISEDIEFASQFNEPPFNPEMHGY
jgi:hypothetical protein